MHLVSRSVLGSLLATLLISTPTMANTLPAALANTYQYNPELLAAHAALRSTDEEIVITRSGYRPSLSTDATASETDQDSGSSVVGRLALQVERSLFDGFIFRNAVRSAIARVDLERGTLGMTEQGIFLSASTAYVDVRRDTDVFDFREAKLNFLKPQVRSSQTRFDLGDETNTAIAKAHARKAVAFAQLARAQAQRTTSESTYRQIFGKNLTDLQSVVIPEALLPTSLPVVIDETMKDYPNLTSTNALARSARFDVDRTRGALRPKVELPARVDRLEDNLAIGDVGSQEGTISSISVQLHVPSVLAAELAAIGAERDSVLASYTLLAATGNQQITTLDLPTEPYEPNIHYDAVNDQRFGTTTRSAP